jgi:hypothetical protein
VTIQQHWPVDKRLDCLTREQSLTGFKEQSLAADIQALAEDDTIQSGMGFNPPALYRQPQRKTLVDPAIGIGQYIGSSGRARFYLVS